MAKKINGEKPLRAEELSLFCAQIAMMLNSGMMLYDGMEALAQTHESSAAAGAYRRLSEGVNRTGTLYEALKEDGNWPKYLVEMTGIGERTGRLEEVMNGLAEYYSRESRIHRAIVSAVTYPMVLGVMMLLILLVMIIKVLPVFQRVLANIGVEISMSGNAMMRLGVNVGWAALIVVALAVLAALVFCLLLRTRARRRALKLVYRVFPPLSRVNRRLSASRVASVLSMMLASGFPLDEALNMVPMVLEDDHAREQAEKMAEAVRKGNGFAEALAESRMFDEIYNCMIRMGVNVGCADGVMSKVSKEYEMQTEEGISNLVSIIEPSLVALLTVVIGAVLMSVMLPMAGILSSML